MPQCKECGSHAICHNFHGRDGSDGDLCDVCYWRKRATRKPFTDKEIADIYFYQLGSFIPPEYIKAMLTKFARAIESAHGIN